MATKKVRMKLDLTKQEVNGQWPSHNVTNKDAEVLAVLLLAAYTDSGGYEAETLSDAEKEVQATLEGKYGTLLGECSFVIQENEGDALSTSVVTLPQGEARKDEGQGKGNPQPARQQQPPLEGSSQPESQSQPQLAFLLTHPSVERRGMASYLLKSSINSLLDSGYKELYLEVLEENEGGTALFKKFGFQTVE